MRIKKKFDTKDNAWMHYYAISREKFNSIFKDFKLDNEYLRGLGQDDLAKKEAQVLELLNSDLFIITNTYSYKLGRDFSINDFDNKNFVGFEFSIKNHLKRKLGYIRELIHQTEQTKTVDNIENIVSKITNDDLKAKLEEEFKELKDQLRNNSEESLEKPLEMYLRKDETEIRKGKMEMMDKWSEIVLKFIDRESIASIVGSLLLLGMGTCIIILMFKHEEPIKIIETSFLLILGYFFGHSKGSK